MNINEQNKNKYMKTNYMNMDILQEYGNSSSIQAQTILQGAFANYMIEI